MRIPTPIDQMASSFSKLDSPEVNQQTGLLKSIVIGGAILTIIFVTYSALKSKMEKKYETNDHI